MKTVFESKTIRFNFLTALLGLATLLADPVQYGPEVAQWAAVLIALINIGLRMVTTQPVTALIILTAVLALLNLATLGFVVYSLAKELGILAHHRAYWAKTLNQAEKEMGESWREYNDYRWLPGGDR